MDLAELKEEIMDVNRTMLIRQLAKNNGYTIKESTRFVDSFIDLILSNIQDGNSVSIYGFGCFDLLKRKAQVCPSRRLGKMIDVPAHYMPRFYPGVRMNNAVKAWEAGDLKADE